MQIYERVILLALDGLAIQPTDSAQIWILTKTKLPIFPLCNDS
ncbi:20919_t:CDS:2, partial [Dentiscutata erythropus]